MRPQHLLASLALLVAGCSSEPTTGRDGATLADAAAGDTADGPSGPGGADGAGPDVPVADGPTADAPSGDAPPVDAPGDAAEAGPQTPMALTCATCAPGLKVCPYTCH